MVQIPVDGFVATGLTVIFVMTMGPDDPSSRSCYGSDAIRLKNLSSQKYWYQFCVYAYFRNFECVKTAKFGTQTKRPKTKRPKAEVPRDKTS